MSTIAYAGTLVTITCWCGLHHAIPSELRDMQQRHKDFEVYCPLGHKYVIAGETEAEKYRRLYRQERDRLTATRADLDQTSKSLAATKGVVTRLKKRASAGVCAFCHRHFTNVERHVAAKHPEGNVMFEQLISDRLGVASFWAFCAAIGWITGVSLAVALR